MNMTRNRLMKIALILGFCVSLLPAEQLLKNGSFEHNVNTDGDTVNWPIADFWSYFGTSRGVANSNFNSNAQDGEWRGWAGNNTSGMSQVTDYLWAANKTYTLKFYVNAAVAGRGFIGQLFYMDGLTAVDIPGWSLTVTCSDADTSVWESGAAEFVAESGAAYIGKPIGLRLTGYDLFQGIDNVVLETDLLVAPVTPANEATRVPVETLLEWEPTSGMTFSPTKQVLYLRANDPNWTDAGTIAVDPATSPYDPTLAYETTYYWRVDTYEPNAPGPDIVNPGPTWVFSTESLKPEILIQPAGQIVQAGQSAQLWVEGLNITSYQWYFSTDTDTTPESDIPLGTAASQRLENVQLANEGWYYCVVSNNDGDMEISAPARVMTRRLVGWWQFESNLADSVQLEIPGAPAHDGVMVLDGLESGDPNFATGILGDTSALDQWGDGEIVLVGDSTDYFNFYPLGFTVAAWVKTDQIGWGAFAAKQQRAISPYEGFVFGKNGGALGQLTMRDPLFNASQSATGTTVLADDAWHLVIGAYSPENNEIRLYTDGILESKLADSVNGYAETASPLVFGRASLDTEAYYDGLLDELRIWNYALPNEQIGQMYVDIMGGELCVEIPEMDLNQDCTVDVQDFILFVEGWLDCGIAPAIECQ